MYLWLHICGLVIGIQYNCSKQIMTTGMYGPESCESLKYRWADRSQVEQHLQAIARFCGIRTAAIVGGLSALKQASDMNRPFIDNRDIGPSLIGASSGKRCRDSLFSMI